MGRALRVVPDPCPPCRTPARGARPGKSPKIPSMDGIHDQWIHPRPARPRIHTRRATIGSACTCHGAKIHTSTRYRNCPFLYNSTFIILRFFSWITQEFHPAKRFPSASSRNHLKIKINLVNPQRVVKSLPRTGKLQHPEVPLIFNLAPIMKYRIILIWANHIDHEIYSCLL